MQNVKRDSGSTASQGVARCANQAVRQQLHATGNLTKTQTCARPAKRVAFQTKLYAFTHSNNKFENEPCNACENTWPWKLACFPCCSFGLSGAENPTLGAAATPMELSINHLIPRGNRSFCNVVESASTMPYPAETSVSWNQHQPFHTYPTEAAVPATPDV